MRRAFALWRSTRSGSVAVPADHQVGRERRHDAAVVAKGFRQAALDEGVSAHYEPPTASAMPAKVLRGAVDDDVDAVVEGR